MHGDICTIHLTCHWSRFAPSHVRHWADAASVHQCHQLLPGSMHHWSPQGSTHIRFIFPNLDMTMDTISNMLKVECVCSRCSGAARFFLDAASTETWSFWGFLGIINVNSYQWTQQRPHRSQTTFQHFLSGQVVHYNLLCLVLGHDKISTFKFHKVV